jgi:hypothetical protein
VSASDQPALFDLKGHSLYQYSAGGFTLLDGQAQTIWADITSAGTPVLYDLETGGAVFEYTVGGRIQVA